MYPDTGALRRAIQVRDRHCTHPGCHVPAHKCHIDHIHPRGNGGITEQLNGRLLCLTHHRWRHRHEPPPVRGPLTVPEPDQMAPVQSRKARLRLADGQQLIDGMSSWWSAMQY